MHPRSSEKEDSERLDPVHAHAPLRFASAGAGALIDDAWHGKRALAALQHPKRCSIAMLGKRRT